MTKMKTAVFTGPEKIEIQEIELPLLGHRQVLIKVKACALCTWEQRFFIGSQPGDYPFRGGHEVSGIVVELGPGAMTDVKPGDGVALAIKTRCGGCENCRRGMDNYCENESDKRLPGQPWGPGGLSEYVIADDYQVYKAAEPYDFPSLSLSEPVACVIRSVNTPPLEEGDTVVVQGVGVMGLLHVMMLRMRGAQVIVSEPDSGRREKALEYGAKASFNPLEENGIDLIKSLTNGKNAKAVFFTAGGVPAIEAGLPLLEKGGWMCLYGSIHPKGMLSIDPNLIHYNELVISGSFTHTKSSFRKAVALLSQGQISTAPFISQRVNFSDVQYAFERAICRDTYRVVVDL
ncbi:MAG: alcohol dehydrogenase catalytic domain-containing protein [Leptolinea sp.]